ncbi:MAG TPA: Maf family protein [Verrucomicrobiae bacterium]|nr:Maf family protein [Verrucomicrobiae bacterium]
MKMPPLILASASPRRSELLRQLGVKFQVLPSAIEETESDQLSPHETCQINAYRKARAVAKQHPDMLVLGADTVVCLGSRIYGKPADRAEALRMLSHLQGQTHEVVTGLCLLHLRAHRQKIFAQSTTVTFRPLRTPDIRRYLDKIDPLDKAGGYAIQEHGELLVQEVSGSFSNVVGLPLERLQDELLRFVKQAR